MRYALRNKDKLIHAFDEPFYNLLIASLKAYTYRQEDVKVMIRQGKSYRMLQVPNLQASKNTIFEFIIVGGKYDVLQVAFFKERDI